MRSVLDLLALDPSLNAPGCTMFRGGRVICAERVRVPQKVSQLPPAARYATVADLVIAWARAHGDPRSYVYEHPQWYQRGRGRCRGARTKGDPNDLAGLLGVSCEVSGRLGATVVERISYTPAEWTHQVPKVCPKCKGKKAKACKRCGGSAWRTPRGIWIRSRLREDEIAVIEDSHDAIDSVGVGLHSLDRLGVYLALDGAV